MSFWDNFRDKLHLIAAHRGDRSIRAENTMSAFENSLGKADFIELDVNFTKDGVAVIIHDDTLQRTSDADKNSIFKKPYKVIDYTYEEIKQLDFSSWFFKKDPFKRVKKDNLEKDINSLPMQRISKLSEVLQFAKVNKMPLNIEIKDMTGTPFDKIAPKEVVRLIEEYNMNDEVLISSFNHSYIKKAKKLSPLIDTAALEEDKIPSNIVSYLKELKASAYHPHLSLVTKELVQNLNKHHLYTNVYTVNSTKIKELLFDEGVKAIFTDYLENMPK